MGLLDGRVAIVTGAGRGIGREEALLFAREGARVLVNDNGVARDGRAAADDADCAERVAAEIRSRGGEAVASDATVATMDGARAIVARAVEAFGGVDVLVNNAGIVRDGGFLRMAEADFDDVLVVQLRGAFNVAQCSARRMVEQKRGGRIINTTSLAGMLGNYGQANLSAAMAGVYALTRTLAIELRKHAITVNAIAPVARTRTTDDLPMFHAMPDETFGPRFVAPAALYLASSLARDVMGEVLAVAGARLSAFRLVETAGVLGDDPTRPWTAEQIAEQWEAIGRDAR